MIYEIINPSDPFTIECDCREAAFIAILILGNGAYGLRTMDDAVGMPVFILSSADEWWKKEFGHDTHTSLDRHWNGAITALESIIYGHFSDREFYTKTLSRITVEADKQAFIAEWRDKRSSCNDIQESAFHIAGMIREKYEVAAALLAAKEGK